jgi:hypothetical protein
MARSLLLSAAVAAAVFGAATAEFVKFSTGTQITSTIAARGCNGAGLVTGGITDAYCLKSDNTNIYKWTGPTYTGGKFSGSVAAASSAATTAAPAITNTNLATASATVEAASKLKHIAATGTGTTFIGVYDLSIGGVVDGVIATIAADGTLAGMVGAGTPKAAQTQFGKGTTFAAIAAATPIAATAVTYLRTNTDGCNSDACITVPPIYSIACNGAHPSATAGAALCLIEPISHSTANTQIVALSSGASAEKNAIGVYASYASTPAIGSATSDARKVTFNGAIKYTSNGYFVFADGYMLRYAKHAAAVAADLKGAPDVGTCDALINAGATCATGTTPTYTASAATTAVHTGLALSQVKLKGKVGAFAVSTDGKTLVFVEQEVVGTSGTTDGTNNIVRCTYATFATDAGSACMKLHTYTVPKLAADFAAAPTDMFQVASPTVTARYTTLVFGAGDVYKKDKIETFAIGLQSRTVTPQTPAPNCKRNGRKYCTKTKTLVKAPATTNTTTNGSTTNTTNTTTKTTTTTTSASAPLLASAWAMVGVVAALIAA